MSDKLEALSQPVGVVTNQLDGAVIVESDQLLPGDNVYSQEHVTALTQRANAAEQREEHLKATVDVLSAKNAELETGHSEAAKQISSWRNLAKQNIAEREKDIASLVAARQRAAELEQRLQQHIKLPERYSVDCGVVSDPSGDWLSLDDVVKVLGDAGVEVRSPCSRCNRLLDLTSRPDGAHYCHHKVEGE